RARAAARLHPGGMFALWSDDPPDDTFVQALRTVFVEVRSEVVAFDNPLTGGVSSNTVYLARTFG
ncbi:MAG: spermidine synthase, partial [Burkholderiaceae bacterium]|nr:spermidine synthase [Microbacteriaceae bacterium]